ncbi:DUF202 domain-containing protein [bacterium]|nr:DUF202 domain-containing protein [bacterium]
MQNYDTKKFCDLELRDLLALERTNLANERTFLAYLRTSVMLLISSITFIKLFTDILILRIIGFILIPVTIIVALIGLVKFISTKRKISLESDQTKKVETKTG